MVRFYQAHWSVVSTDGEAQPMLDSPAQALSLSLHRRSYGSYPLLLGHYVRELKVLPLEAMIRKMTGAVAEVADRTSWVRLQEYPAGIRYVLLNGRMAVENGKQVEGRFGRIIRRG